MIPLHFVPESRRRHDARARSRLHRRFVPMMRKEPDDKASTSTRLALAKTPANFEALTPLSFLARAARVYPDYPALIHGPLRQSWAQTEVRCRQLASALRLRGIGEGDTVSHRRPQCPGHVRGSLRRAHERRRAQHHQHPARCRVHGLHLPACPEQGGAGGQGVWCPGAQGALSH